MSVSTGSSNRNIFAAFRAVKIPTLGQLRDPISLYRSTRRPKVAPDGSNTVHFDQEITSYANVWAKVFQAQTSMLAGQAAENFCSHAFIIRNDLPQQIEMRDYVLWQGRTYQIKGTKLFEEDTKHNWLLVVCEDVGGFTDQERVVYDGVSEDDEREPSPYDADNPLWR